MNAEELEVDADLFGDDFSGLSMIPHGIATEAPGIIGGNRYSKDL